MDGIIKKAEAAHPTDPYTPAFEELDTKHDYTKLLKPRFAKAKAAVDATLQAKDMANEEARQAGLLQKSAPELDKILNVDAAACNCNDPPLKTAAEVLPWVQTKTSNVLNFVRTIGSPLATAKLEAELCAQVPEGTMVWVWGEKDGNNVSLKVQVQVDGVTLGDKYDQTKDRIEFAFIKIDKSQVKTKKQRDRSTDPDEPATTWIHDTNGWDMDDAGHVIGAQFGGSGRLKSGNIFPQDKKENWDLGSSFEQNVGGLARLNKDQTNFHMCLAEVFNYLDWAGSYDLRPMDEEFFLLQVGTPDNPKPTPPESYKLVDNPNNNTVNPTNSPFGP